MLTHSEVSAYLDDIGVTMTKNKPSLADLCTIQKAHICRIPFNNLSTIHNNAFAEQLGFTPSVPDLEPHSVLEALVHQKRWFCTFRVHPILQAVSFNYLVIPSTELFIAAAHAGVATAFSTTCC